jgi:FLVCR family feline leukemia virus subgroup C receptor-related protein
MFTILLVLTGTAGGAIGFLLPGSMVGSESSPDKGKELFMKLLLIEAIIATVLSAPVFIFFREKPPTPPSPSASVKRENFKNSMKLLVKNKPFLVLLLQQCTVLGAVNSFASVLQSLIDPFGYTQMQSSILGTLFIVSSVLGCLICGFIVQKNEEI